MTINQSPALCTDRTCAPLGSKYREPVISWKLEVFDLCQCIFESCCTIEGLTLLLQIGQWSLKRRECRLLVNVKADGVRVTDGRVTREGASGRNDFLSAEYFLVDSASQFFLYPKG